MAEVLIKLERASNESDLTAWTRLHPVSVRPDGFVWGAAERPPKFLVVRLTGMTVEQAKQYIVPDTDNTDLANPIYHAIRKYKFDIDDATIPKQVRKKIDAAIANGTILEVTQAQIAAYIKRTR